MHRRTVNPPNPKPSNEIGHPLLVDELALHTVVCVRREDRDFAATFWVETVATDFVVFLAAAPSPKIHFLVFRLPDGTLIDDSGGRILVYEYLGKV